LHEVYQSDRNAESTVYSCAVNEESGIQVGVAVKIPERQGQKRHQSTIGKAIAGVSA
jgi:hypothetical protein